MKNTVISILAIFFLSVITAGAQNKVKFNPVGKWQFEAPTAPEGYTGGVIVVGMAEKKPTATMSFTGSEYNIPGERVKVSGDSLNFQVYLEGDVITVLMKAEANDKMSGKATYSEGEVPLTATRQDPINSVK
ncbi:MAG TPA: hypothetical protein VK155_17095 [Bacteroidales bacterium]|jgi:hypothetical protein|nr:hypothetical protein [Bacteroidales bacterium]